VVEFSVSLVRPRDLGATAVQRCFPAGRWAASAIALSPVRLMRLAADRRWETWWFLARKAGQVVGIAAAYKLSQSTAATRLYDPAVVAPEIGAVEPPSGSGWLHIGGVLDLVSGVTVAASMPPAEQETIRRRLVAEAVATARREGMRPVALYVRDEEVPSFRAGFGDAARALTVTGHAVLDVCHSSPAGYLSRLDKKRRYRVRREWGMLDERCLRATEAPVPEVITEAAPLIAAVKQRHQVPDHPRLAATRLKEWAAGGADDVCALTVRDDGGTLLGASFVASYDSSVELYEVGIPESADDRHLIYTELLVYAPLRYAWRRRATRLVLGLESTRPKSYRGARIEPVWSITLPT
jgi:hypothetical protein